MSSKIIHMETVGQIVRAKRENLGLLLRQVASYLDIDQAILSKIERNERKPTKDNIIKLAEILKLDKEDLLVQFMSEKIAYEIADEVFAVGTPAAIDLGQTVSKGIISGIRKETNGVELIQTDVSVNPGNSGGALIKRDGTFVGVVNAKISGGGMEGLGFCTPAKQIISELKLNFK